MFCLKSAINIQRRDYGRLYNSNLQQQKFSNLIQSTELDSEKIQVQKSKIAVISGAGGQTAKTPILKLREAGYQVIALTGSKGNEKYNSESLQFVRVDRSKLSDREYVVAAIRNALELLNVSTCDKIVGINLIGSSIAPSKEDLISVNFDIPMVFFESVSEVGQDISGGTSLLQISSIAATINGTSGCTYASLKKKTDEHLLGLPLVGGRAVALRPGIVLPNPTLDGRVNMGHDYSPEQFCNWKVLPVIGSGNQIQQPVGEECLYQAGINALESDETKGIIVNAVGPSIMTQKQLFAFFNPKANYFMHLSPDLVLELAEKVPLGRLAPYSVKMFAALDEDKNKNTPIESEEFNRLFEDSPKGIFEIYDPSKVVVGRKAPIAKHCSMIGQYVFSNNPLHSIQFIGKLGRHFVTKTEMSKVQVEDRLNTEKRS